MIRYNEYGFYSSSFRVSLNVSLDDNEANHGRKFKNREYKYFLSDM